MNMLKLPCADLVKPVAAASRACTKGTVAIAEHVLLDVKGDVLHITGCNFNTLWIRTSVPLEMTNDHWQSVPNAKKLLSVLKALPHDAELTLVQDDTTLTLRAGKSAFKLLSLNPADVPDELPRQGEPITFTIDAYKLAQRLSSVAFAAAKEDVRYYLNGICLEAENGQIKAIATNGHRLAHSPWLAVNADLPKSVIIPSDSVTELLNILNQYPHHVATITLSDQHVEMNIANTRIITGLIDGRFPDWKRTIDENPEREIIKLNRLSLLNALNRMSILANQHKGVRLTLTHELTLTVGNEEAEEGQETVVIERDNTKEKYMGLNVQLLIEALRSMSDDTVQLSIPPESNIPLHITADTNSDDAYHLISPMRL